MLKDDARIKLAVEEFLLNIEKKMTRTDSARKAAHARWDMRQRDTVSSELFDKTPTITYQGKVKSVMKEFFGRELLPAEIVALGCAHSQATIIVSPPYRRRGRSTGIGISSNFEPGPDFNPKAWEAIEWGSAREIVKTKRGQLILYNHSFSIQGMSRGTGTRAMLNQIKTAQSLGISKIFTDADGQPGRKGQPARTNGYYTWAAMGYNGKIDRKYIDKMPHELKSSTIHDLVSKPGGLEWWKDNGGPFGGSFDLTPGSKSMRIMEAFADKYGAEWR